MQVTISIGNYSTVSGQLKGKIANFATKVGNSVQGAGIDCEGNAKQRCPVDTGRLRSSIAYTKINQLSCRVGTNVKYAPYVEFGTYKMHPQPYLFPAYLAAKQGLLTELKAMVS
jgi:HK97 gp10 family phage protein